MPSLGTIAAVVAAVERANPVRSLADVSPAAQARLRAEAARRDTTPEIVLAEELAFERERRAAEQRVERIASRARRAYRESGTRRTVYTSQA